MIGLQTQSPAGAVVKANRTDVLLRFGVFELDLSTAELRKSGVALSLPRQPLRILVLLASHPGQLVTREQIQQEIWGSETFVDFEQGLNFAINKIRTSLGDNADTPRYIETLPRRGYRFIAPVQEVTPHPAERPQLVPVGQSGSGDSGVPSHGRWRWWKRKTTIAVAVPQGSRKRLAPWVLVGSLIA